MSLTSKASSGIKNNAFASIISAFTQALQLTVLARLLSPEDFGLMAMIEVVIGFARLFSDFGVGAAIIQRKEITPKELSTLYIISFIMGLVIFILLVIIRPLIVIVYDEPRLSDMLLYVAIIFLFSPIGQQYQNLLQRELKFNQLAKIEVLSSISSAILAIILAFLGFNIYALIIGEMIRVLLKSILSFVFGRKIWIPSLYFNFYEVKEYLKFGLFQMGEKILNYFNQRIDQIIIGILFDATTLGYYTLAYNIAIAPYLRINPILTKVAFPVFSKVQDNMYKLKIGYLKLINGLSLINFPILLGLVFIAPDLIPIIFGEKWINAVVLLQILSIVALIRSIISPIGSLLLSKGRADLGFYWNLTMALIHPPVIYFGISNWGVVGCAVALVILYTLHFVFGYLILMRKIIGKCLKLYIQSFSFYFLSSLIMGILVNVFRNFVMVENSYLKLSLSIIFGGCVYFIFNLIFNKKDLINNLKILFPKLVVLHE